MKRPFAVAVKSLCCPKRVRVTFQNSKGEVVGGSCLSKKEARALRLDLTRAIR